MDRDVSSMAVKERTLGRTLMVIIRPRWNTGHSRKQRPVSRCASNSSFSSIGLSQEVVLVQSFPAIFQEPVQRRLGVFIHNAIGRDQAGG